MKRRNFILTAGAAGIAASTMGITQAAEKDAKKYIELRTYTASDAAKKEKLIQVLDTALVPALNRQGINPVGIFWTNAEINENNADFDLSVFVLFPHVSPEAAMACNAKLLADQEYMKAAAPILDSPMKEPLYDTLKTTLMLGFEKCPTVEVPVKSNDRLFQLRYYKSYNFERNAAKVHMFDHGGELPLFRVKGMNPVFFGDTLYGDKMPNLTYMLGFENDESRKAAWKAFAESPEWNDIKDKPLYKNTANTITNIVLKPSPGSQI